MIIPPVVHLHGWQCCQQTVSTRVSIRFRLTSDGPGEQGHQQSELPQEGQRARRGQRWHVEKQKALRMASLLAIIGVQISTLQPMPPQNSPFSAKNGSYTSLH